MKKYKKSKNSLKFKLVNSKKKFKLKICIDLPICSLD